MPIFHILIALAVQASLAVPFGHWFAWGLTGSALFIGREHAQAEYRWIDLYGEHHRALMPWYGGLDARVWNVKSLLDWLAPLLSTLAVAALVQGTGNG